MSLGSDTQSEGSQQDFIQLAIWDALQVTLWNHTESTFTSPGAAASGRALSTQEAVSCTGAHAHSVQYMMGLSSAMGPMSFLARANEIAVKGSPSNDRFFGTLTELGLNASSICLELVGDPILIRLSGAPLAGELSEVDAAQASPLILLGFSIALVAVVCSCGVIAYCSCRPKARAKNSKASLKPHHHNGCDLEAAQTNGVEANEEPEREPVVAGDSVDLNSIEVKPQAAQQDDEDDDEYAYDDDDDDGILSDDMLEDAHVPSTRARSRSSYSFA